MYLLKLVSDVEDGKDSGREKGTGLLSGYVVNM
jgi:hypothetical protein